MSYKCVLKSLALISFIWAAHAGSGFAQTDTITILSPHQKSLEQEFVPSFKTWYAAMYGKEIDVEWVYQGGTSNAVRFLRARFGDNGDSAEVDVMWGGGSTVHTSLKKEGFSQGVELDPDLLEGVPSSAGGIQIRDSEGHWFGTALSSFGMFYNQEILDRLKMEAPKTWDDLGKSGFYNQFMLTDPRKSGSSATMNMIILESYGWEEGFAVLHRMAGNAKNFTGSSSETVAAVRNSDIAVSLAIDFYAYAKINELGGNSLGFQLPEGATVLDPDPISVIRGAPNLEQAKRFIEFLLSDAAQKKLMLPVSEPDGPSEYFLGRMSVVPSVYDATDGRRVIRFNPFEKAGSLLNIDLERSSNIMRVVNDLYGTLLVDSHKDLRDAWAHLLETGRAEDPTFAAVPVTMAEVEALADQWDDNVLRNQKINDWRDFARQKYSQITQDGAEVAGRNWYWVLGLFFLLIMMVIYFNGRRAKRY